MMNWRIMPATARRGPVGEETEVRLKHRSGGVTWRVLIPPRAEADLRSAREWYERERVGLGGEFMIEIGLAMRNLVRDPERHPDYYRGFRRVLVQRFPFTSCSIGWTATRSSYSVFSTPRRDYPRLPP